MSLISLICLGFMVCGVAGAAPTGDPLKSPECLAALADLQAQDAAAVPGSKPSEAREVGPRPRASGSRAGAVSESVSESVSGREAARREAAQRCLGAKADAPPPRRPDPTLSRPMPALLPPTGSARPLPTPAPAQPPIQIPTPKSASFCDPTGCLLNDGSRLQRAGEHQLIGPRGLCTLQGTVLFCP